MMKVAIRRRARPNVNEGKVLVSKTGGILIVSFNQELNRLVPR
jgi:hypothetical protein